MSGRRAGTDKPLDKKEILYLQNRTNGLSEMEAYQAAGYDMHALNNPMRAVAAKEKRVMHHEWVQETANRHGLNLDVVMLKISEGLNATTQKEYCVSESDDDGGFEHVIKQGVPRPDHKTRVPYLKILTEIHNVTRPAEEVSNVTNNTINILAIADKTHAMSEDEIRLNMQRIKQGRQLISQPQTLEIFPSNEH